MKIENTVKIIKEIHNDSLIMVKAGQFHYCYGKDAVIISYLFNYVLKKIDGNYNCGFPNSALNKIITKLENDKINYMVVDKADNFEIIEQDEYKANNRYSEIYSKANKYINKKNRINEIYNYLMENINDENIREKIIKVEEIIYEI